MDTHRIKSVLHEEALVGTAWISEGKWERGQPLVLRTKVDGKVRQVSLICRVIDDSFIGYYEFEMNGRYGNPGPLRDGRPYILLSQHYRDKLGIYGIPPRDGVIEKTLEGAQPIGVRGLVHRLFACIDHADAYVRITTWLAIISLTVPTVPEILGWLCRNWW